MEEEHVHGTADIPCSPWEDATVEHKDIPEGTEAHGEPTSEQRHEEEEGRDTIMYWLQPPCPSPCERAWQG